ncbi:MAG: HU family DNA-binding protein [Actinomycetota bacterium]|nr:HU family DNA-binding protein [Actinomycetota bacterium]
MNRTELVDSVAQETGLEKKQVDTAVSAALGKIIAEVKSGSRVSIFGFGTFNPKSNPARTGRNPQTNQPMRVAASKGVGFKAATAFKEALNAKRAATKKAAAKKTAAKQTTPAKKATAAKKASPAKTSPAKTSPAKKAAASKATTTKTTAKKSSAAKKR